MGTAGHRTGELRTALRTRSFNMALQIARELRPVSLRDGLDLTLLAAHKDPDRYERMARRWLERFLREARPTLQLSAWVSEDLAKLGEKELPEVFKADAESRLREVAGK